MDLTISELARACGVTTRALRHYDAVGLLPPAATDPSTGYRTYRADQVPDVRLVARLRALDVPIAEVRACLDAGPPDRRAVADDVLRKHRVRLEARATRVRGDLHRIDHLLAEPADVPDPGAEMTDAAADPTPPTVPSGRPGVPAEPAPVDHRRLGVDLFNETWTQMEREDRDVEADDRMVHGAHASAHHWAQVGTAQNRARSEWQCSRVYAVLGRAEPALHHARRVLEICTEHGIGDFDLAFAHEALARAAAVGGDAVAARAATEQALAAAEAIADPDDRALLVADLETIPGQPRFW